MTLKSLIAALALAASAQTALVAEALAGGSTGFRSELIETGVVHAPRGFTELCDRRPETCPARKTAGETDRIAQVMAQMFGQGALTVDAPELTPERFQTLTQVNAAVNAAIRPVADMGPDLWSFSPMAGDCEEYAMLKREMLARLGWPRTALRVTVVQGADYQYHAVLVVSTRGGEFILDNMIAEIVSVRESAYAFIVSQSMVQPGEWVRVER